MAGSLKWMTYTDDQDFLWSVKTDESNGENTGFTAFAEHPPKPLAIKMREMSFYFLNAPNIKRTIPVGTMTVWQAFIATPQQPGFERYPGINSEEIQITHFRGERRSVPSGNDTGLNDGDNP